MEFNEMNYIFDMEDEDYDLDDKIHNGSLENHNQFLSPKESSFYASNQIVEKYFLDLISDEKLPHAFIFSGPQGIGKATFAYRLVRFLFKYGKTIDPTNSLFGESSPTVLPENMDMSSEETIFRKIISGGHPDFLILEPAEGKKGLDVAQIRKITPFLRKTASEDGGWRIVLVDDADSMNRNAQNALLKILEEPPRKTLLLLISHNSGSFLPTIISRCRMVHFEPPNFEVFDALLHQYDPSTDRSVTRILYDFSSGSIGKSLQFISADGLELLTEIKTILKKYPNPDFEYIHLFCERFSGKENETWNAFCTIIVWIFHSICLHKARGDDFPEVMTDINNLNTLWSLEELLEICELLEVKLRRAEYANLDNRQCALEIFMILFQSSKQ